MSKYVCEICGQGIKKAIWKDAVKRNGACYAISAEVEYNETDDTYHLDDMIAEEIKKIPDFDEDKEELILFSFHPNEFTREDIIEMDLGVEDIGAFCTNCKSFL